MKAKAALCKYVLNLNGQFTLWHSSVEERVCLQFQQLPTGCTFNAETHYPDSSQAETEIGELYWVAEIWNRCNDHALWDLHRTDNSDTIGPYRCRNSLRTSVVVFSEKETLSCTKLRSWSLEQLELVFTKLWNCWTVKTNQSDSQACKLRWSCMLHQERNKGMQSFLLKWWNANAIVLLL